MVANLSQSVTSDIPHGCILGPLLFAIYINDLPDGVKLNVYLFADDAKIYKSINSLNDHDIDKLIKWSSDWFLTFNCDKCKFLTVVDNTFEDYD